MTAALSGISVPTLVISISSDMLTPSSLQKELSDSLGKAIYKESIRIMVMTASL